MPEDCDICQTPMELGEDVNLCSGCFSIGHTDCIESLVPEGSFANEILDGAFKNEALCNDCNDRINSIQTVD